MHEASRLRRDITWNLVPLVLLAGVGLGLSFAISAIWGAGAFGVFDLVRIVFFVFAVIGACGLQFSVLRAVAEAPEDRDDARVRDRRVADRPAPVASGPHTRAREQRDADDENAERVAALRRAHPRFGLIVH